jgi:hypothetical protein
MAMAAAADECGGCEGDGDGGESNDGDGDDSEGEGEGGGSGGGGGSEGDSGGGDLSTQTRPMARPHQGTQRCTRHRRCRRW